MSNYSPIYTSIWSDVKFTEYEPEQQLVFLYLITNSNCKTSGIYQVSPKEISYSTNVNRNTVLDILKGFDKETLEYDSTSGIIFIKNHFKYNFNTIGNPKVLLSTLLKNCDLTNHDDFWQSFIKKYEDKISNLVSRIKDLRLDKNNNSTLNQHLLNTYLTLNQHLTNTKPSLSQDLCSNSISNRVSNSINNKEKEVEKNKNKEAEKSFDIFWKNYTPIKTKDGLCTSKGSRKPALTAYQKALKNKHDPKVILDGLERYLKQCQSSNRLTCAATTFLNQERFLDEEEVLIQSKEPVKETSFDRVIKKYEGFEFREDEDETRGIF